jgi:hypothetical protein
MFSPPYPTPAGAPRVHPSKRRPSLARLFHAAWSGSVARGWIVICATVGFLVAMAFFNPLRPAWLSGPVLVCLILGLVMLPMTMGILRAGTLLGRGDAAAAVRGLIVPLTGFTSFLAPPLLLVACLVLRDLLRMA